MAKDEQGADLDPALIRLRELLEPARLTEIVDVGANPTEAPVYQPLLDAKVARVTGFEPQASVFEALANRESAHERYLPYAVGDGRMGSLNVCQSGGFTSLYRPDALTREYLNKPRWRKFMEIRETVPLETKRLDELSEIVAIDLLKIDIQGGELAVFENGRSKLSEALVVITEVGFLPIYEHQPLVEDQVRELRGQGFLLHSFQTLVGGHINEAASLSSKTRLPNQQLIDGDAVFLRDPRRMDGFSDEALKHYALIASGALRLPDLVARCLKELIRRDVLPESAFAAYCETLGARAT
ncbi:methyltransferase, FkbM family [Roseivivax halotolerans]|uniref:Methyltransferase, FkbM family n=1 Tax=Roseivivax halotolerans TaxID=93684 RepID=A0A1I5WZA5_9RHOB|nr:FkbM family methyltransferase [Roseivivax halotolerans]SFQ25102.1 methyltransferase, FkbM family [Roseivivax halotolerans]